MSLNYLSFSFYFMSFLPQDFESPQAAGQYLKLKDGESIKLRILTDPIFFWEFWSEDKTPIRVPYEQDMILQTPKEARKDQQGKFVWAMVVYNYNISKVQIWSPSQAKFKNELEKMAKDPDFGDPKTYDLKISRKGTMMETEYSINALMKAENMQEMDFDIVGEAALIKLENLIINENPFPNK